MNLIRIAESWYKYIQAAPETKKMMEQRLVLCDTCPNKVQLSSVGQVIAGAINKETSLFKCGLCGCPLSGLTAHPKNRCSDKQAPRWVEYGVEDSYF